MNNHYKLVVQHDGNMVIYKSFNNWASAHPIWGNQKLNPVGIANPVVIHQKDGNFVHYHNGHPVWATGTQGKLTTRVVMQNDGNLCLYWGSQCLWASHTNGK